MKNLIGKILCFFNFHLRSPVLSLTDGTYCLREGCHWKMSPIQWPEPGQISELKSTCCSASLHAGFMTSIDSGPTFFCSVCQERDKKAEEKYDALNGKTKEVDKHFIWH